MPIHIRKSSLFFLLAFSLSLELRAETPQTPGVSESSAEPQGKAARDRTRELVEKLAAKVQELESLVASQQFRLLEMEKQLSPGSGSGAATLLRADYKAEVPVQIAVAQQRPSTDPKISPAPARPAENTSVAGWNNSHAFLRRSDGSNETFFTGYAQLDFRGYQAGNHPPNTFIMRRARTALEGRLERYFEYKLEGDFADTASTLLRDLYARVRRNDALQFTFGHFRVPISQEEMRSDAVQDFVERSVVNNLIPGRSPGFMISGAVARGAVEYQLGAFNGKGLLAANNNSTPETAARLRLTPWREAGNSWLKGLTFGGAATIGRESRGNSVRGQTESRSFVFFAPELVNGRMTRANAEMTWLRGPAAIRAEYDQVSQQRRGLRSGGGNLPAVVGKGIQSQFTYLITGETKTDSGSVTPRRSIFDQKTSGGVGAWELKVRYANLQVEDGTPRSNRVETFHFGINWYLNPFVRSLLDLGVERFKDPLRSPRPGDQNFFVIMSRMQFSF